MKQDDEQMAKQAGKTLAQTLSASDEYQELMAKKQKVENDAEALQLVQKYQQKLRQQQQMGGLDFSEGESLEDIREKMEANELVQDYLKAENEWSQFVEEFFQQRNEELDFDITSALGGCC